LPQSPKSLLKALELLKEAGYDVDLLHKYVQDEVNQQDNIKQVWTCSKCDFTYKSQVNLTAIGCPQGHPMKLLRGY
jgi:protein-arginine kinase activator protein McsA